MTHLAWTVFDAAFGPFRRRALSSVLLAAPPAELPRGPIVFVANHVSWWDGFLLRELQRSIAPTALPSTVMLERELRKRPVLRALGAIGIEPGRVGSLREAVRTLEERRARLGDRFCLFYFPQGRIWPSYRRPLGFVPGLSRIVRRLAPITIVPVAIHLEPLNRLAPTACVRAGRPLLLVRDGAVASEHELEQRVEEQLDYSFALAAQTGEDLVSAWS